MIVFTPNPVNVAPGGTVTWTNTDTGTSHTVTSGKPDNSTGNIVAAVFDSSLLPAGKTFSHTFTAADVGTINYFCQVHPWMAGQVSWGQLVQLQAIIQRFQNLVQLLQ